MDFSQLNETDVREEILAPLIRELGYRSGAEHNVVREQSLRYPQISLGRKNDKRDPILRGKADYILEAGGRVRWVIEAKAPSCALDIDDIEQCWTYANHPEVRAVYFVMCNGLKLSIFQTNGGPNVEPIFSLTFEQLQEAAQREILFGILSPQAVLRDHPRVTVDTNIPLAAGLRSVARITNGYIRYDKCTVPMPAIAELQVTIIGGAIERDERNGLVAYLESQAPTRTIQAFIERMGLSIFEMSSSANTLSTDMANPTTFVYEAGIIFPEGEELHDLNTWQVVTLQRNVHVRINARAMGALVGNCFAGTFRNDTVYDERFPVSFEGHFCLFLA